MKARPRLQRQTSVRTDARVELFGVSAQPDVLPFGDCGRRTRENLQRSWREALALTQGESQTSKCEATVPTTVVWMGLSIEISSILIGDGGNLNVGTL